MAQRFLNNNDYISIVTEEALSQLIRGKEKRLAEAEEAAEQSVLEYLSMNYEVERELAVGKMLLDYNPQITYPAGAHFYLDGEICQTLRTINGIKAPMISPYWGQFEEMVTEDVRQYSQRFNYKPGEIVSFGANIYYECLDFNGPDFNNIRIPGTDAWEMADVRAWEPNISFDQWDVICFEGDFFTLLVPASEDRDLITDPMESDDWGKIGEYREDYTYELSDHEYVVYKGHVFYPVMNPNADKVEINCNIKLHDPRNPNLKKHILRLAIYELHKLISPTNVSSARITDYETSILWLRDASKLKLNPGIPRKIEQHKPVADFATATYMRSYNPYENMWHFST